MREQADGAVTSPLVQAPGITTGRPRQPRRRALAVGLAAVVLASCGGGEPSTGTTLDVCSLLPPAQVEEVVGSQILLKPIVPKVDVQRPDLGAALLDLLGDDDGRNQAPAPTRTDRVPVQGLCGYVFSQGSTSSTEAGGAVQSLVLGVYPVPGDADAWLDTTARKLSDVVLVQSGTVPTVSSVVDLGDGARLLTTGGGTTTIVLAVDQGIGVVAEGSAIDVEALTALTRAALAAAAAA